MLFYKEKNEIVKEIISTNKELKGYKKMPISSQLMVGDDLNFFDEDFKRKPKPKTKENETAVWEHGWKLIPDYTDKTFYNKKTKEPIQLKLGKVPTKELTEKKPISKNCKWDEEKGWVENIIEEDVNVPAKENNENI